MQTPSSQNSLRQTQGNKQSKDLASHSFSKELPALSCRPWGPDIQKGTSSTNQLSKGCSALTSATCPTSTPSTSHPCCTSKDLFIGEKPENSPASPPTSACSIISQPGHGYVHSPSLCFSGLHCHLLTVLLHTVYLAPQSGQLCVASFLAQGNSCPLAVSASLGAQDLISAGQGLGATADVEFKSVGI